MTIESARRIYIVGIKGVANANLAVILQKMGKYVSGSDLSEDFITDAILAEHKIAVAAGFAAQHIPADTDLVIYTGAHNGHENIEVQTAVQRGITTLSQAQAIAQLASLFQTTLAVCGCHGKTNTTALLTHALIKLGAAPSYLIGTAAFNSYPAGDYQPGTYFVVEADEYAVDPPHDKTPKFLLLHPSHAICVNIDFDHPDVYASLDETKAAFAKFFHNVIAKGAKHPLGLCADDAHSMTVAQALPPATYQTFGYAANADLRITVVQTQSDQTEFALQYGATDLGWFSVKLFGEKIIGNVAGVILLLLKLGFTADQIRHAIADFTGAQRRFEHIAQVNGIELFDDYAHHPAEIKAVIQSARSRFPEKRLVIIFQPHTFSRTQAFRQDFRAALSQADLALILPIFGSAREQPDNKYISSADLVQSANHWLISVAHKDEVATQLQTHLQKNDMIMTMGAGDVYKLKDDIIRVCQAKFSSS